MEASQLRPSLVVVLREEEEESNLFSEPKQFANRGGEDGDGLFSK